MRKETVGRVVVLKSQSDSSLIMISDGSVGKTCQVSPDWPTFSIEVLRRNDNDVNVLFLKFTLEIKLKNH